MQAERTGNIPSGPAFVAGATGYVGRLVVRRLADEGVAVVAHVRPDSGRLAAWQAEFGSVGVEVDTSPWEVRAMAEALRRLEPAAIFCCIGTTRDRMRRLRAAGGETGEGSYDRIDYGLTALLLEATLAAGIRPRFVYLSALGAGPGAGGKYLKARHRAEQAVIGAGIPFTIVRPAIVTGPDRQERRPAERWGARLLDGALSVLGAAGMGHTARRYRSIGGAELAAALVRLAYDPAAAGRIIEREELGVD